MGTKATHIESILSDDAPAGSFKYFSTATEHPAGITFLCPCGCRARLTLNFSGPGPKWAWNGNVDEPTLTPSVVVNVESESTGLLEPHWHGHLRSGEWTKA